MTVTLDRSGQPEGDIAETVFFFDSGDPASLDLTASVEIDPVILRPMMSPDILWIPGTTICGNPTGVVTAIVTDHSSIASVVVHWSPTGGNQVTSPIINSGSVYLTTIGPFVVPGNIAVQIVATDTRGNTESAQVTFTVVPCP